MKLDAKNNVVSISSQGRREERRPDRHGNRQQDSAVEPSPDLLQQLRKQVGQIEQAIRRTEESRATISGSADTTAQALRRFEQTLVNLRVSLENQRSAAAQVDTAMRAGDAAALVKAQILVRREDALLCHAHALPQIVANLIENDEETPVE